MANYCNSIINIVGDDLSLINQLILNALNVKKLSIKNYITIDQLKNNSVLNTLLPIAKNENPKLKWGTLGEVDTVIKINNLDTIIETSTQWNEPDILMSKLSLEYNIEVIYRAKEYKCGYFRAGRYKKGIDLDQYNFDNYEEAIKYDLWFKL